MNENQTSEPKESVPTSAVRPTKKQRELLSFIEQFITEHGYSPSYREIMNGLHYTSVATVALHVGNLIKRGHLRKRDHSARSLEVVPLDALDLLDSPNASGGLSADTGKLKVEQKAEHNWLLQQTQAFIQGLEDSPTIADPAELDKAETLVRASAILRLPVHGLEDR